jgi:site-specific recombinase XerD
MLVFALHTGLRISEWTGLVVGDVAENGVPRSWLYVSKEIAKFSKARWVPLNAVAQKAIAKVLAFNRKRGFSDSAQAPLWPNKYHKPLGPRAVQYMVAALREKAGIPVPVTPHVLRHCFATRVMERTGNLRHVQDLIGHANLRSVECYTALSPSELEKATNAIAQA